MRADVDVTAPQHYGIKGGTPLAVYNLMAVCLYTDFTDLCSNFSSTFRKIHPYESLSSIKRRNSKYWWMSKILRETVELYGKDTNRHNGLKGPFFTGMSFVMTMPEFMIRLCSPTSTTVHIEVATKFSGQTGIIIKLKAGRIGGVDVGIDRVRAMDVSWISRYREEDERYDIIAKSFTFICIAIKYLLLFCF